jgi:hypothetical protein
MGLGFGLKLSKAIKKEEFRQFLFLKTIAKVSTVGGNIIYLELTNSHINILPTVETVGYNKNTDEIFIFSKKQFFKHFIEKQLFFMFFYGKKIITTVKSINRAAFNVKPII